MNIITYAPVRDSKGRFRSIKWKKLAYKTLKIQLLILHALTTLWLAKQHYNITCSAGGHFMTKEKCGELARLKDDSLELDRLGRMSENNKQAVATWDVPVDGE